MKELFKVNAVAADDSQSVINAKELTITIGGNELQLWASSIDDIMLLTLYSRHASFTLRPDACNGVSLSLQRFEPCSPTNT